MGLGIRLLVLFLLFAVLIDVHSVAASRSRDRRDAGENPGEDEDDEDDDDNDENSNDNTKSETSKSNRFQVTKKRNHRTQNSRRGFRVNMNHSRYRDMILRLRKHLKKTRPQKTFILNNKNSQNAKKKMKPSKKQTPKRVLRYRNIHHTNRHRYRSLHKQQKSPRIQQHTKNSLKVKKMESKAQLQAPPKRRIISTRYGFQYAPSTPEKKNKEKASNNQVEQKTPPVDYTANNIEAKPVLIRSPSVHQIKSSVKSTDVVTTSHKNNSLSPFLQRRQFLDHRNVVVSKANQRHKKNWSSKLQSERNNREKNSQVKTRAKTTGILSTPTKAIQTNTLSISSAIDAYPVKVKPHLQTFPVDSVNAGSTSGTLVNLENKSKVSGSQTSDHPSSTAKSAIHPQHEEYSQVSSDPPAVNSDKGQSARLMSSQSDWVDPSEDAAGKMIINTWKAIAFGASDRSYGSQSSFNSQNTVHKIGQDTLSGLPGQTAQDTKHNSLDTVGAAIVKAQDKHQDLVSTLSGTQDNNLNADSTKKTQGGYTHTATLNIVTTGSKASPVDKTVSSISYRSDHTGSESTSQSLRNPEHSITSSSKNGKATPGRINANNGWETPSETVQFSGWSSDGVSLDNILGSVNVPRSIDRSFGSEIKKIGGVAIKQTSKTVDIFGELNTGLSVRNTQKQSPNLFSRNIPGNSGIMISTSEVKEAPTIVSKITVSNIDTNTDLSRAKENNLVNKQDFVKSSGNSVNFGGGSLSSVGDTGDIYNLGIVNSAAPGSLSGGFRLLNDKASVESASKSADSQSLVPKSGSSSINSEKRSGPFVKNSLFNAEFSTRNGRFVALHEATAGPSAGKTVPKAGSSAVIGESVTIHETTSGSLAAKTVPKARSSVTNGGSVGVHDATSGSLAANTVLGVGSSAIIGGSIAVHEATSGSLATKKGLNAGPSAINDVSVIFDRKNVGSLKAKKVFNTDKVLINPGSVPKKLDSVVTNSLSDLVDTHSASSSSGSSFIRAKSTLVDMSTKNEQKSQLEQKIISVPLEISDKSSSQYLSNFNQEGSSGVNTQINSNNRKHLHFGTVPEVKVEPIVKIQNGQDTAQDLGSNVLGFETSSKTASLTGGSLDQSGAIPRTITSPKFDFIRPSDSALSSRTSQSSSSTVVSRNHNLYNVKTSSTVPRIRVAASTSTNTNPIADVQELYNELGGSLPELNKAKFKVGIVDFHLSPEEKRLLKSESRTSTSNQSDREYSQQSQPNKDSAWNSGSFANVLSIADKAVVSGQDSIAVSMSHADIKGVNKNSVSERNRAKEFAQTLSATASQQENNIGLVPKTVGTADKVISLSLNSYHTKFADSTARDTSKLAKIESNNVLNNKVNSQNLQVSTSNTKSSHSNHQSRRLSPATENQETSLRVNTGIAATYTNPQAELKRNSDGEFASKTNDKVGSHIQNTGLQVGALYNPDQISSGTRSVMGQNSRILHSSSSSNVATRASSSSSSGVSLPNRQNQFLSNAVRPLNIPMLSEFHGPDMHAYRSRIFVNTLHNTPSKKQSTMEQGLVTKASKSPVDTKHQKTQLSSGLFTNGLTVAATKSGAVIATGILKKKPDKSENAAIIPVVNNDISSLSRGIIIGDTSLKSLSGRDGPYDTNPKTTKISGRTPKSLSRISPMNGIISGDSSVKNLNGLNMFQPTAAPPTQVVKQQAISTGRPGSNAKGFSILWMAGEGFLNRRTGLLETPGGPISQFAGAGKDPNAIIQARRKFRRHGGMAFAVGDAALKGLSGGAVVDIGGGGFRRNENHKNNDHQRNMRGSSHPRLNVIEPVNVPMLGDSSFTSLSLRRMPTARMQNRPTYSQFNQRHIFSSPDQRNNRFRFSTG